MQIQPGRVTVQEGVVYGTGGDRELRCDVYTPPEPDTPAPAVLLVHGGAWVGNLSCIGVHKPRRECAETTGGPRWRGQRCKALLQGCPQGGYD